MALDGDQAVDALDDAVDVVTLDRRMPNVTGDENFYGGPDETRSAPRGD